MMRRFRVGERARLRYVRLDAQRLLLGLPTRYLHSWRPGIVVTVVSDQPGIRRDGIRYDYEVDFEGRPPNARCRVIHDQLEPLTPPLGDWREIEAATGWHPAKAAAPASAAGGWPARADQWSRAEQARLNAQCRAALDLNRIKPRPQP